MRRAVAVGAAVAVLLVGGVLDRGFALEHDRAAAQAELLAASASVDAAAGRTTYLEAAVDRAETDTTERAAVLEVRPAFLQDVSALAAAMERADGRVDTTVHRVSALSAQETVRAERRDPEVITRASATVRALTQQIDDQLAQARTPLVPQPTAPGSPGAGTSAFERVRAALDQVGGAGVGLSESSSCAGGAAPACANSDGYIKYRADIADWSTPRLHWAMAHELAHIYQFRVWGALNASATYGAQFGGDPEFLANCMALVRGYPGDQGCDAAQQAWASGIWVGAVR